MLPWFPGAHMIHRRDERVERVLEVAIVGVSPVAPRPVGECPPRRGVVEVHEAQGTIQQVGRQTHGEEEPLRRQPGDGHVDVRPLTQLPHGGRAEQVDLPRPLLPQDLRRPDDRLILCVGHVVVVEGVAGAVGDGAAQPGE